MQVTSVRLGGLLAAAGGLLSAGVLLLSPSFDGELPDQLTAVANSGRFIATNLLELLATLLVVVGVLDELPG